ncbi:hypothetical protein BDR04DRAFT_1149050 [Suillus decipiens]|nr:hypothetical protein BDR04DRAFT_1149050 [Suillus decipiens]
MPLPSKCKELLDVVDQAELLLAKLQYQDILDNWDFDSDFDSDSENSLPSTSDDDDDTISLSFSSLSPPSPISSMTGTSDSLGDSSTPSNDITLPYDCLRDTIHALRDEVKRAHVFQKLDEPPL